MGAEARGSGGGRADLQGEGARGLGHQKVAQVLQKRLRAAHVICMLIVCVHRRSVAAAPHRRRGEAERQGEEGGFGGKRGEQEGDQAHHDSIEEEDEGERRVGFGDRRELQRPVPLCGCGGGWWWWGGRARSGRGREGERRWGGGGGGGRRCEPCCAASGRRMASATGAMNDSRFRLSTLFLQGLSGGRRSAADHGRHRQSLRCATRGGSELLRKGGF